MSLSIIMPMLNEADSLPETLRELCHYDASAELILVDGGSTDDSVALAHQAGV
ncbi:glycosyl transferase, partial [Oceanisphaera arctica]